MWAEQIRTSLWNADGFLCLSVEFSDGLVPGGGFFLVSGTRKVALLRNCEESVGRAARRVIACEARVRSGGLRVIC